MSYFPRLIFSILLGLGPCLKAADLPSRTEIGNAVLARYATFTAEEKQTALTAMAGRAETARLLLTAMAAGKIARSDLPGYVARQIADLNDAALTAQLETVWGKIMATGAKGEAAAEIAKWKAVLTPEFLSKGTPRLGRALFASTCGTCHTLFDSGAQLGPNLTGANRSNVDYWLENITQPSAVLGADYMLHTFNLRDGRAAAGMVRKETDTAFVIQTLTAEETIAKADIVDHGQPGISMMPQGLLTAFTAEQVRDLFAYLMSPAQVSLEADDPRAARVPGAIEGESLRVLDPSGTATPQDMRGFSDGRWSGGAQLWWKGASVGDILTLALPIAEAGTYEVAAVFTRAPDYGTFRVSLDGTRCAIGEIDGFGSRVTTTSRLILGSHTLSAGTHRLTLEITGAHPSAQPGFMVGLDYLSLRKP
jgi:putative heme-binding domain-containing protein